MLNMCPIKRALLSVSNKSGIVDLAQQLVARNIQILSTGGTARCLQASDVPVTDISEITGFPEIMDGRVKTLHPKIHGALLGRREEDHSVMEQHGIEPIDLLVVNLYPFEDVTGKSGCSLETAIENIDIGGCAMIRAGAKNYTAVAVVVDEADYATIIDEMNNHNGALTQETRLRLAKRAFAHTAHYDALISNFLGQLGDQPFSDFYTTHHIKKQDLRYGENPHQAAAFYVHPRSDQGRTSIASAEQLSGKPLSYNNIVDVDAAMACVSGMGDSDFKGDVACKNEATCVIVKHSNPCGVALGESPLDAYRRAFATDPTSSFGGIIALNRTLDAQTAQAIIDNQFVEVIAAPDINPDALTVLKQKKNLIALRYGNTNGTISEGPGLSHELKYLNGGLLIQECDNKTIGAGDLKVVTKRAPTESEINDLLFAWGVVKFVKSNAIVFARNRATVGIGAGQMSRVDSVRIAIMKARDAQQPIEGAVMASDAFFPFRDGVDLAAKAGIAAIIQPGGSIRDEEVIQAADEYGIAMVLTGIRHFKH